MELLETMSKPGGYGIFLVELKLLEFLVTYIIAISGRTLFGHKEIPSPNKGGEFLVEFDYRISVPDTTLVVVPVSHTRHTRRSIELLGKIELSSTTPSVSR